MNHKSKIWHISQTLLVYFLSVKYICFGIPKMFEMQFTTLRYISYTPLAELSKHDHMWSFFGRSYNYNLFIAITEIIIGILIVFKKTRLIALLLMFGVSLNILILNIEFDNDFALYHSAFDFIACIVLLTPYLPDLIKFFLTNSGSIDNSNHTKSSKFQRIIPTAFVSILFIGYSIYAYSLKSKFKSVFEGTYIIEGLELNSVEMNLNKGKTGEYPMFFIEYNRQVALSMNDTLTFGEIYKIDNIWYASFNFPNTDQYARVKINEQELSGRLFSKTNNKPLDSIRIKINRMPETQNYLNRR